MKLPEKYTELEEFMKDNPGYDDYLQNWIGTLMGDLLEALDAVEKAHLLGEIDGRRGSNWS